VKNEKAVGLSQKPPSIKDTARYENMPILKIENLSLLTNRNIKQTKIRVKIMPEFARI
jgi:hypothetical protein